MKRGDAAKTYLTQEQDIWLNVLLPCGLRLGEEEAAAAAAAIDGEQFCLALASGLSFWEGLEQNGTRFNIHGNKKENPQHMTTETKIQHARAKCRKITSLINLRRLCLIFAEFSRASLISDSTS